jgi:type III secretion protein V
MNRAFKYADLILMGFVVAIAAMLIVPLPTQLLDVLLVFNISFSLLLLLVGLYVPQSSALYTFPTVLLLSTLFRLGLNVASSRLILSQGDAGRVIEAFGTFLIRGEVVVGLIIFTIVTIVNFIVISKGAARVSEVAARFALDSLPGKQVAIDNDARAGVISSEEARRKRDDLRRESQLYGSMDGAMRFVQGDAVAGFFIIIANIVGGISMGLLGGLSFPDAVQTYTMLTVGDGLVTQIPSLLTSICAGIIVTRVSGDDSSSLGMDLHSQLFAQPVVLVVTGAILTIFAFIPGVPTAPFAFVAVLAFGAAIVLVRKRRSGPVGSLGNDEGGGVIGLTSGEGRHGDDDGGSLTLVIGLEQGSLYRIFRANSQRYTEVWRSFRESFFNDVGIQLPELHVVPKPLLSPSGYSVTISGVETLSGVVPSDAVLVEMSSLQAPLVGISVLCEEEHPLSSHRVFWAPSTPALKKMVEGAGIRSLDFLEFIIRRVAAFCLSHPDEFLSVTDVHSQLRQVEKRFPGLVAEGFGREFISVSKLTDVLQELVRQGVSIRDFRSIIEAVASYCSVQGITLDNDSTVDVDDVVRHVRHVRRRQIVKRVMGSAESFRVIYLSPDVEEVIRNAEYDNRALPLALENGMFEALCSGLERVVKPALDHGATPVCLLCSQDIRVKVLSLIRSASRRLFVASYEELDVGMSVEQIGMWELDYR